MAASKKRSQSASRKAPANDAGRIEVVYRSIEWFKPNPRNARTHSKKQIRKLARLEVEFGFTQPILAEGDGTIIAGHGRHEAARFNHTAGTAGFAELPTVIVTGWSREKIRAYILADNKIAEEAGWDDELLKLELSELSSSDFDVSLTGFSEAEIGRIIAEEVTDGRFGAGDEEDGEEPGEAVACTCPHCGHQFKAQMVAVEKKTSSRKKPTRSGGRTAEEEREDLR